VQGPRLVAIDGLRALAAACVLVYHVWRFAAPDGDEPDLGAASALMPHLWHGVTLFFVISGFLLYRPFAAAALRGRPAPSVRRYLRNRALRILPAYWVVLLLTAFVLQTALVPQGATARTEGVPDAELLVLNLLLLQNFSFDGLFTGVGPAWSLAVEVVFYAVLPLLALLALRARLAGAGGRARALAPIAFLLLLGLSGRVAAHTVAGWELGVLRSFWALADLFALGMLVAVAAIEVEDGRLALPRRFRAAAAGLIVAVAGVGLATDTTNLAPRDPATSVHNVAVGAACALLVALVVLPGRRRRGDPLRLLELRAVAAAGLVSYSAFLWHEPLLRWLRLRGLTAEGGEGFLANLALVALVTGLVAAITYRLVEVPALRLKARASRHGGEAIGRLGEGAEATRREPVRVGS
jgi:peptidoglycan/LPS O-acetylase OafA/YrhL